jgi:GntR family transcriptional regulator
MSEPKYQQIAHGLREKIARGEIGPGDQLPTELELREEYDASRNTIRDAIKVLLREGLITTQPGRGTFVPDTIDPFVTTLTADPVTGFGGGEGVSYFSEARASRREPTVTQPQVEIQAADPVVARHLRVPEGDQVVSRHQKRLIDGKPYSLQTSWYPFRFVEQGATELLRAVDVSQGVVEYLREELGVVQTSYQDLIEVRPPNDIEIAFFGLVGGGGVAICEIRRTAYDRDGKPYRLTVTVYPSDRNLFLVNVGDASGPHD